MFGFWRRQSVPPSGVSLPEGVLACLRRLRIDAGGLAPVFEPQRSNAYVFPAKGRHGPSLWEALRKELPSLGYWPVLLGDDDSLERHREMVATTSLESPSQIIAHAVATPIRDLFDRLRKGCLDPDNPNDPGPEDGEWPDHVELTKPFYSTLEVGSNRPLPRVWIGLFPTGDGCEVPANLGFGDWNDCPPAHEHVAALKHWRGQYGVELAAVTSDIIELRAARRPATRSEALALAREQFYYCSDIVDQGVGSIAALAKVLMEGDFWFFWWD